MTSAIPQIEQFLSQHPIFGELPPIAITDLAQELRPFRYPMGEVIFRKDEQLSYIVIIYQGQARTLGFNPCNQEFTPLEMVGVGEVLGWVNLARGQGCETAIASTDIIGLVLDEQDFNEYLEKYPSLQAKLRNRCAFVELFELIGYQISQKAQGEIDIKPLASLALEDSQIYYLPPGESFYVEHPDLQNSQQAWLISSGGKIVDHPIGSRLTLDPWQHLEVEGTHSVRLVGVPVEQLTVREQKFLEEDIEEETEKETDDKSYVISETEFLAKYQQIPRELLRKNRVYVEEGDQVEANKVLLKLDSTASAKELVSLKKIQKNLQQENKFYQNLIQQSLDAYQVEVAIAILKLPQTVADLTRNRATLITENRLFGGLVNQGMGAINLSAEQFARLQATRKEVISRATAAQIEVQKLHKQLNQNQVQLAEARVQLAKDQQVLGDIDVRNQLIQAQARESLRIEQEILDNVSPLLDEGAIPQLQIKKQQQQVNDRYAALVEDRGNGAIEYERQQQQIENRLAEIQQLNEEQQRLQLAISQAEVQLTNTTALAEREIRDKIANNEQRIAEIDSQLTKIVIENEKRIAELDSQISGVQVTLKYQELRSPVAGTVFDLQASPGYVPPPSRTEALLKIVPDDYLVAEVNITTQDIGFVREGMRSDVRIDSFPFSEFGDIKGEVVSIGSDALPPDEIDGYYRFPVKVRLDSQLLETDGREIPLQSGMSVSVNIKVREDRTVMSLLTELFTKKIESLKQVR
ncbi:HlyD family efflux transporter periplasmic adaptor subunit [Crocosphaera watsonii]|uniref:HlyD family of secretion proteins n=1 Tax=Crocosphaera watsonii WH 0401 TaxID=555881 RepID=T2JG94_CROWT|nr:HlyD family efflux transporter periplasmic adaptor subunit [Crocosphaera watsonii]CCQ64300.1 HlyD family of secretion proteins [Crocosphaera watsonii WH 0401]